MFGFSILSVSGRTRLLRSAAVALVLAALSFSTALAYSDAFEFVRWTGRGDGTFSLSYLGRGCLFKTESCQCDLSDYRFRVNVNRSSNFMNWRFWSGNGRYQKNPTGRPIYGHSLHNYNAHVCVGSREFSSREFPNTYWTTSGVTQYLYTWRE